MRRATSDSREGSGQPPSALAPQGRSSGGDGTAHGRTDRCLVFADIKASGSRFRQRSKTGSSLAADAAIFPCLPEQPLGEIEPLLCFCQLLLDVLETTFNCLEPRSDVGR